MSKFRLPRKIKRTLPLSPRQFQCEFLVYGWGFYLSWWKDDSERLIILQLGLTVWQFTIPTEKERE